MRKETSIRFAALLFIVLSTATPSIGQERNAYIRRGAVGGITPKAEEQESASPGGFKTIEIANWVGERVMFAPKSEMLSKYGYQSFKLATANRTGLPYEAYVGKFLTIQSVTEQPIIHRVELETDDGERIIGDAYHGTLDGIVFVRDLELARKLYLNKSLWLVKNDLLGVDASGDKFFTVPAKRWSRVTVKDVVIGSFDHTPIRFVLETDDGREGYQELQMSGTNVSRILRDNNQFSKTFSDADPRVKHAKWGKKILDACAAEKAILGMTQEQAVTSWGKPESVNRTTGPWGVKEQWVYGDSSYLYFTNGKLTAVQN